MAIKNNVDVEHLLIKYGLLKGGAFLMDFLLPGSPTC